MIQMIFKAVLGISAMLAAFSMYGIYTIHANDSINTDKYFELNAPNLNTMNSYIIPSSEPSDLNAYDTVILDWNNVTLHIVSTYPGLIILLLLIFLLSYYIHNKPNSRVSILFLSLYHAIWEFFEDLLGENTELRITKFVTHLFLVIFLSNIIGIINDIIRFAVPQWLRYVTAPTAEFEFNLALALIAVGVTIYIQGKQLGVWGTLHEYFPIKGKGLIEGNSIGARIGDIIISMFIGFLDVIGLISKIVSLSMRLFGNMSSGSILLNVSIIGFTIIGTSLFGFAIPIGLPIITYIQSLLVAFVQAFVFTLIVVIGIKAVHSE